MGRSAGAGGSGPGVLDTRNTGPLHARAKYAELRQIPRCSSQISDLGRLDFGPTTNIVPSENHSQPNLLRESKSGQGVSGTAIFALLFGRSFH